MKDIRSNPHMLSIMTSVIRRGNSSLEHAWRDNIHDLEKSSSSFWGRGLFSSLLTLAVRHRMLTLQVLVTQGSETRSSCSVEQTWLLHFGFETWVSRLCWEETWTSHYWLSHLPDDIWDTRTSWAWCFDIETRVSYLWEETWTSHYWTSRLWGEVSETWAFWALHFRIQMQLRASNAVRKGRGSEPHVLY